MRHLFIYGIFSGRMECKILVLMALIGLLAVTPAAAQNTVQGVILNDKSEPLQGVTILINETGQGASANADGYFEVSGLDDGDWTMHIRYVGYITKEINLTLPQTDEEYLRIELAPDLIHAEELLVTSSMFDRISRYQSTQTFSASEIQQRNTTSMGTLLDGEAGVAMRSMGQAPARPVIRGMDGERIQVLQNGMKMGDISSTAHDHAVMLDPMDTERIDIVRGPSSLIYGSSAMGGVINAHTEDIPSDWVAGYSGHLGSEAQSGAGSLAGGGRIMYANGPWAATFRSSLRNTGDMKTPIGKIPGTDQNAINLGSGFAYRSDIGYSGLSLQYSNQRYGIPDDPFDLDQEVELTMERMVVQGLMHRRLNSNFWNAVEFRTVYNFYTHNEYEYEYENGELTDSDLELAVDQHYAQASLLIQHGSRGSLDNGTAGLTAEFRDVTIGGDEALAPDARIATLAGYLVEEFAFTQNWMLQAGLRLEWNRTESFSNEDFPEGDDIRNHGIWAGAIGISGPVASGLRAGVQLSRAHRTPSVEELFSDAIHLAAGAYEIGDPSLGSEIGYGSDIYLDYDTESWNVHLALYANHIRNYITQVPTGETEPDRGLPVLEYRGSDAEIYGGEIVLTRHLSRHLRLTTMIDYIYGDEVGGDSREPLAYMPPLRISGSGRYDNGTWWTRLGFRNAGKQSRTAPSEEATDGYTLVQVAAGVRLGTGNLHHLTASVENLFDVTWRDHLSRIEQRDIPMMGRNARISYRFYF